MLRQVLIDVQMMTENCHPKDAFAQLEKFAAERFADHSHKNTEMENQLHAILISMSRYLFSFTVNMSMEYVLFEYNAFQHVQAIFL